MKKINILLLAVLILLCSCSSDKENEKLPFDYMIEEITPGFYLKSFFLEDKKIAESFGYAYSA